MKSLLIFVLLGASVWGQTPAPTVPPFVNVTVQFGPSSQFWQFYPGVLIVVTSFYCTQPSDAAAPNAISTLLMPGDSSTCTVFISQPAPVFGVKVQVTIPAPFTGGPDGGVLTIPAGALLGTFTVTYPVPSTPAAALPIFPAAYSIWAAGNAGDVLHFADVLIPCCAQADLCGLDASQVDMEACGA